MTELIFWLKDRIAECERNMNPLWEENADKRKHALLEMDVYMSVLNYIVKQEKASYGIAENAIKEANKNKESLLEDFKDYI